jgi:hypothetical protein
VPELIVPLPGDGGTATSTGPNDFETQMNRKQTIQEHLLEYCKLDTLAMVDIKNQ